jgi:hypothetical protein
MDNRCLVPLSHSNHGWVCPVLIDSDMEDAGNKNCDYFEDVASHTHD